MIHLLGLLLVPPCIDPLVNDDADGNLANKYVPGPWSPVAGDVDCPECKQWVHA